MPNPLLIIGGRDSSNGAGITVDLEVAEELQCKTAVIMTADTQQNTHGVQQIIAQPATDFRSQLRQHLATSSVIKIGMLATKALVDVLCDELTTVEATVILDPVLSASLGGALLEADAMPTLMESLLPRLRLVTPNLGEAERLLGCSLQSVGAIEQAAQQFIKYGARAVLIKGGHGQGNQSRDYFLDSVTGVAHWFSLPRVNGALRGTGCRLATAIGCYLLHGQSLFNSVKNAKTLVYNEIYAASHR